MVDWEMSSIIVSEHLLTENKGFTYFYLEYCMHIEYRTQFIPYSLDFLLSVATVKLTRTFQVSLRQNN